MPQEDANQRHEHDDARRDGPREGDGWSLIRAVIEASESDEWEDAVEEWEVASMRDDPYCEESCVCGHEHLRYLFTIRNRLNGHELHPIGSSCIEHFGRAELGRETKVRRQAFELAREAFRLGEDDVVGIRSGLFTRDLIRHMAEQGVFSNGDEQAFLTRMFHRRKPMDPWQEDITRKIIRDRVYPWLRLVWRECCGFEPSF